MIKKLSIIGLCGVSLIGLTACGLPTQNETPSEDILVDSTATEEEGSDKVYYRLYEGWGITPKTLFDALNKVDPNLKLDESLFTTRVDENTGEKVYTGSPAEKVVISYLVAQTDANYNIEDEAFVGMLSDGLDIRYDKTDEAAAKYATDLLNAFQTVLIQGLLPEAFEAHELMSDQYLSKVTVEVETYEPGTLWGDPIEELSGPYAESVADFKQVTVIRII